MMIPPSDTSEATLAHLQALIERDKASLARDLHDKLGGFLLAASMDLATLRHRLRGADDADRIKLDRVSKMLDGAIDLARELTEELHPTLLDNVGLFAALRWQMKTLSQRTNIPCTESFPAIEPRFGAESSIALFRIGQEALALAARHDEAKAIGFHVTLDAGSLRMRICADGGRAANTADEFEDVALAIIRHRIDSLHGQVILERPPAGGVALAITIGLAHTLAPA
jgi:signal transduction histidine kinase